MPFASAVPGTGLSRNAGADASILVVGIRLYIHTILHVDDHTDGPPHSGRPVCDTHVQARYRRRPEDLTLLLLREMREEMRGGFEDANTRLDGA